MNYKLKVEDGIAVLETATETLIKKFSDMEEARQFRRFLNFGGGFDGWTPNFFLKSVSDRLPENKKKLNKKRKK